MIAILKNEERVFYSEQERSIASPNKYFLPVTFYFFVRLTANSFMKKYTLLLTAIVIYFSAAAQKTINDPNAAIRNVASFHAVEVSSGIDLYLTQGNEAVAVSATSEDARNKIITKVGNGVLKIYLEHGVNINFGNK